MNPSENPRTSEHETLRNQLKGILSDTVRWLLKGVGGPLALGTLCLMTWQFYGSPGFFYVNLRHLTEGMVLAPIADHMYWFLSEGLFLFVIPLLAARFIWKIGFREMGLGLGNWRLGLTVTAIFYAVMVPVVIIVSTTDAFTSMYPLDVDLRIMLHDRSHESNTLLTFLAYEAGYAQMFVSWEYFFRGFLLFSLKPHIGGAAIAVQMVPFALLHVGKPVAEAAGSIVTGILLGVLAWRTRSIWYCVLTHAAVAITMDVVIYLVRLGYLWQ